MGSRQTVQCKVSDEESFIIGILTTNEVMSYKYKTDIVNKNQK